MIGRMAGVIILLLSPIWHFAHAQSPLLDPGFEPGEDRSQDLQAWNIKSNGFQVEMDESILQSGTASLRLSATDQARGAFVQQTVDGTFLREQSVRLTGYIKTENLGGSALLVAIVESGGNRIFKDDMRGREVGKTTDWTRYEITIPKLPDAETLTVGALTLGGTGKAWFDAFEIKPVAAQEETSTLARDYLNEALDHLQKRSLFRRDFDWADVRQRVESIAAGAQSTRDTYPAIRYALQQLKLQGDRHSYFQTPVTAPDSKTSNSSSQETPRPIVKGRLIDKKFGYLDITGINGSSSEDVRTEYVDSGHRVIEELSQAGACGWIVDLHKTGGGTMWPILAAVGPVLGEGVVGSFVDGERKAKFWYRDGAAGADDSIKANASADALVVLDRSLPPVVVLTSSDTASASETIAISFIGRPNTLSVGRPTWGLTSSNSAIPLSDGAVLVLATAHGADRDGNIYTGSIGPDQEIAESVNDHELFKKMLDAASEWLSNQPGCRQSHTHEASLH